MTMFHIHPPRNPVLLLLPYPPPSHLGVAGFLDAQVSRRQVAGDRDAELLRRQATFFEERQPRIPH